MDKATNAQTVAQIRAVGGEAFACHCDVTDEASYITGAIIAIDGGFTAQ